jgi:hypothetical protein
MRVASIFGNGEENLRKGSISKPSFRKFLEKLEQGAEKLPQGRRSWWLAEIYKRKAGIDSVTPETEFYPNYLIKAWIFAKEANNYRVLTEVGHYLSFRFISVSKSIRELAEIQLSVVLGICNDEGSIERLQIFGNNLEKFWKQMSYRRLRVSDLPYLSGLRDKAVRFEETNIPDDLRPPLMILLLLKTTGGMQSGEYRSALDWAFGKLTGNWGKVSEEDRIYLADSHQF